MKPTRRELIALSAASALAQTESTPAWARDEIQRHDRDDTGVLVREYASPSTFGSVICAFNSRSTFSKYTNRPRKC